MKTLCALLFICFVVAISFPAHAAYTIYGTGTGTGLEVIGAASTASASLKYLGKGTDNNSNSADLYYEGYFDITYFIYTKPLADWATQVAWADSLSVQFGGTNFSNWRLPTADPNKDGTYPTPGYTNDNEIAQLRNFFTSGTYWSGTTYTHNNDPNWAWQISLHKDGSQDQYFFRQTMDFQGLAVHPGDLSAVPVPEPATMLLLGTGLVGVACAARRKKKNQS